ncbi:MAG: S9 family peptidase, partial [Acidobacteria bacterium]|nr:S9 family peptidase [Acidobacteriota bacterium]
VGSVAISPDGTRTAYVLSVPRDPFETDNGRAWGELHVIGSDGVSRPFIAGDVTVSALDWTPDGKSISFLAKRGKDEFSSLYVIDAAGGEARRLLAHGADIASYSWSPDGKQIAFLANEAAAKERTELEKKGFTAKVYEENPRPSRIWVAPIDGSSAPKAVEVDGSAAELHWAPAGSRIAVALAPTSLVDQSYTSRRVHVIDVASGKVIGKTANPGKLGSVAWSPDGKHLALISAADRNDPSAGRLMVADASTGALRELLPGYEGQVRSIAWSDADTVLYVGDEGVFSSLAEADLDGTRRTIVPAGGQPNFGDIFLSSDGSAVAFAASTPSHPAEVFLWRRGGNLARATISNPRLAELPLATQEVIRYKARDGLELEGLLIRPLSEKKGTRYPLIVTVHGGPESHYRNEWLTSYSSPGQFGASRGFAVFYPNYRGSTGRGVPFSKLSQKDPAGKEFDDIVDGVDHLIGIGLVDRAKVGVTGGSYGGYATGWLSTFYSERFAAGVMFVGISDLISKWGTTDIPQEELDVHALQYPWDDWQFFLERSPIHYTDRSKTPLLILHGEDDPRVNKGQSMELYRYLKVRGQAPVRLVFYPGEGHGNQLAAARLDYTLRMMRWFEHYLKGSGGAPPPAEVEYR